MIEKDNIQELFSKAFENQTATVKPELWAGVQAKMAAAGVASTATVATKGLSALTKWLIGSAAVGTVGVVTTVIALNSGEESVDKKPDHPKEISQNVEAPNPEENKAEQKSTERTIYIEPNVISNEPFEDIPPVTNPDREIITEVEPLYSPKVVESVKATEKEKPEEKAAVTESKREQAEKKEQKDPKKTEDASENVKRPEDTKEPVKVDLVAKVTNFPNIFTPNGDGSNDNYAVKVENISDFKLTIIDQDNHVVFETIDPALSWDGTFAGDKVKEGMYAAIVTGKQQNGKSFRDIQLFELRR